MASVLSHESLVHAVAGAVGSVTAMTVFFPLDTARLRLQVDEKRKSKTTHAVFLEIIKEEGLLAPYCGWFPVISSLCCSNFVYFYTFNSLKAVWVKGQRSSTGKDLVVGFVAGLVNVLLTTPLWVVNTRLKLQGAKFRNEDIIPTNYKGIIMHSTRLFEMKESWLCGMAPSSPCCWSSTLPSSSCSTKA